MAESLALADALDSAADAAEQAATDQRRVARSARELARRSRSRSPDAGVSSRLPVLLAMLAASAQRLSRAAHTLRRAWVRSLVEEGHSMRSIGGMLGVSHQRVSALLHRPGRRDSPDE